jgi:hypothetical protein
VPEEKLDGLQLPPGIVAAIDTVDWEQLTRSTAGQGIAD